MTASTVPVLRKLLFVSDRPDTCNFLNLFGSILRDPSNSELPSTEMAWTLETQSLFVDETIMERPEFRRYNRSIVFRPLDTVEDWTIKVLVGLVLENGQAHRKYQRDVVVWLSAAYLFYQRSGGSNCSRCCSPVETMIAKAQRELPAACVLSCRFIRSCWMYVCRHYASKPTQPLLPVHVPTEPIRDAEYLIVAVYRILGAVAQIGDHLLPSSLETDIFCKKRTPPGSEEKKAVLSAPEPVPCAHDISDTSVDLVSAYARDFWNEAVSMSRSTSSDNEDPSSPRLLGKRRYDQVEAAPPVPLLLWRPPGIGDGDMLAIFASKTGRTTFTKLVFQDLYARRFADALARQVYETKGAHWSSMTEANACAVDEVSTLQDIGVAVLESAPALASVHFFLGVVLEVLETSFPAHRTVELFWSYIAVVLRRYVASRKSVANTRMLAVTQWRVFIMAFAVLYRFSVSSAHDREHTGMVLFNWMAKVSMSFENESCDEPNVCLNICRLSGLASNDKNRNCPPVVLIENLFSRFTPLEPPVRPVVPLSLVTTVLPSLTQYLSDLQAVSVQAPLLFAPLSPSGQMMAID